MPLFLISTSNAMVRLVEKVNCLKSSRISYSSVTNVVLNILIVWQLNFQQHISFGLFIQLTDINLLDIGLFTLVDVFLIDNSLDLLDFDCANNLLHEKESYAIFIEWLTYVMVLMHYIM